MTKSADGSFPYLLVEEGLKKNHCSDRLRTFVMTKMWKRAQIEMSYIRQLQEWVEDVRPLPDNTNSGYVDTEITRRILGCMKQEAVSVIDRRQHAHNRVMEDAGPYRKLQRSQTSHTLVSLEDVDEDFASLNHRRKEAEHAHRRHKEKCEHLSNQIEALEGQLSQRSRIVTSRRPPTRSGPRKVEEMQKNLSGLRQQYEQEMEKVERTGKELMEIQCSAQEGRPWVSFAPSALQTLNKMDAQLQQLELDRIQTITDQVRIYLESLESTLSNSLSVGCTGEGRSSQYCLDSIDGLLKVHWVDVRTNAKRVERGELRKYSEMFEVKPAKVDVQTGGPISKGLGRETGQTGRRIINVISRPPERPAERILELAPTESILTHLHSRKSGSESSVEEDMEMSWRPTERSRQEARQSMAKTAKSDESIESLPLPPEIHCPADITRIDPNRQYKTRMKLAKVKDDDQVTIPTNGTPASITEYCQVSKFTADDTDTDDDATSASDVSTLSNIRVIAKQDSYPSPGSNELYFKAGQVIKQKRGVDGKGQCYGWTKEGIMGKKTFGYYKPGMVRPMKSNK